MSDDQSGFVRRFKLLGGQARSMIVFGLVIFSVGFVGSIFSLFTTPILYQNIVLRWMWGFCIVCYVAVLTWFLLIWKNRDHCVAISDQGIALCSPKAQLSFIRWDDVAKVDSKIWGGKMVVHSKNGGKIRISYEAADLASLVNLLSEYLRVIACDSNPTTFYRSTGFLLSHLNFILIFTMSAIAGCFFIPYLPVVFLLFTIPSFKTLLTEWSKITITSQEITICSALRRRIFHLSEIRNVVLEPLVTNSATTLGLRFDLRAKDPLTLTCFDGIFQAYLNLRQMIEKSLDNSEKIGITRE